MNYKIFTLFPDMFTGPLSESLIKKARDKEIVNIEIINFRDYAYNKHKMVDDYSFGGGQGMVLKPEPILEALKANIDPQLPDQEIILLTPQGKQFKQEDANRLSKKKNISFICGHYEGFDERIRTKVTSEYSIGDFVLLGGELPAMVMIEAISRLIPGVIKESDSYEDDSFYTGLLEYPQYTKPREYEGMKVPDILLSGHHENIRIWRKKESLRRTYLRRPDLLEKKDLTKEEKKLLSEVISEEENNG